jgi:hypothetical protein
MRRIAIGQTLAAGFLAALFPVAVQTAAQAATPTGPCRGGEAWFSDPGEQRIVALFAPCEAPVEGTLSLACERPGGQIALALDLAMAAFPGEPLRLEARVDDTDFTIEGRGVESPRLGTTAFLARLPRDHGLPPALAAGQRFTIALPGAAPIAFHLAGSHRALTPVMRACPMSS